MIHLYHIQVEFDNGMQYGENEHVVAATCEAEAEMLVLKHYDGDICEIISIDQMDASVPILIY